MTHLTIRALYRAVRVEQATSPYDTLHLKVIYPAHLTGGDAEQNLGIVPAHAAQAPFPVVIFFGGMNCSYDQYQWLAIALVKRGMVVVLFQWIAENLPGVIGLTPGVNLAMWTPENYGKDATASALPALLKALDQLQSEGVLAGLLDLQKVILGGHSAGGRVAIESADPRFFSEISAAFAYAAHTAAPVMMGYEPDRFLPLPSALPLLLMGGTCDGVIANSGDRYGITPDKAQHSIYRTFEQAIARNQKDNYWVLLAGANHFTIAHPPDPTTGQAFLDFDATQPEEELRALMAEMIGLFIEAHVRQQPSAQEKLHDLLQSHHPLIPQSQVK